LLLVLSLSACQFQSAEPVVVVEPEAAQQDVAALPPAEPEAPPPPPPPIPVPAPETLVGYTMVGLEGLFGTPGFVRRDPPAELWQYHTNSCVLDLFLYENTGGGYQVTHTEFRETGLSVDEKEDCLRDIILSMDDASG
jgi:hypothetical protein